MESRCTVTPVPSSFGMLSVKLYDNTTCSRRFGFYDFNGFYVDLKRRQRNVVTRVVEDSFKFFNQLRR